MRGGNRKGAEWVGKGKNSTFVYRIHDRPNDEKYADFSSFVAKFGYTLKAKSDRAIERELNGLLREIKGKKEEAEAAVKGEMIRIKRDDYDAFAKSVAKLSKRAEYEIVGSEEEE